MIPAIAFDDEQALAVDETVELMNASYPDTVRLMAHHLLGRPVERAELLDVAPDGVQVRVDGGGGREVARITFPAAVATAVEVQAVLFGQLLEAREALGDQVPLTSLEREIAETASIPMHRTQVVSRRRLTANLVEVQVQGQALSQPGADTFYYALVADDPAALPEGYSMVDFQAQGAEGPVRGAYYTVRTLDSTTGTVTFWVAVHDHLDGVSSWLCAAEAGGELLLWGPRTGFDAPSEPAAVLLVADETGLAAASAIIERLAPDSRAVAVFEVADAASAPPLPDHPGLRVAWVFRDGRAPGTGTELVDAVVALDLDGDGWWGFGGAESRQVTAVRSHLRRERGWPAERVSMTGYWRRSH
jgi:NADPH-dependent ferric siderophore reductase